MTIHMNLGGDSYDILVQRGILSSAGQHLNLNRRVLVVTDSGVPAEYAETVAAQCRTGIICTVETGKPPKVWTASENSFRPCWITDFPEKTASSRSAAVWSATFRDSPHPLT